MLAVCVCERKEWCLCEVVVRSVEDLMTYAFCAAARLATTGMAMMLKRMFAEMLGSGTLIWYREGRKKRMTGWMYQVDGDCRWLMDRAQARVLIHFPYGDIASFIYKCPLTSFPFLHSTISISLLGIPSTTNRSILAKPSPKLSPSQPHPRRAL